MAEKVVGLNLETKQRPPETIDDGVISRLQGQVTSALEWLEARRPDPWLCGQTMTQADVTAVSALTHLINRSPELFPGGTYPALADLRNRAEELPAFLTSPFMEE